MKNIPLIGFKMIKIWIRIIILMLSYINFNKTIWNFFELLLTIKELRIRYVVIHFYWKKIILNSKLLKELWFNLPSRVIRYNINTWTFDITAWNIRTSSKETNHPKKHLNWSWAKYFNVTTKYPLEKGNEFLKAVQSHWGQRMLLHP